MAADWRRLLNEELHNFFSWPNIRVIRSRAMKWARRVSRKEEMRNAYKILDENLKGRTT
jgi:hypothetical protein